MRKRYGKKAVVRAVGVRKSEL